MTRNNLWTAITACLILAAGCASTPPATFYTLTSLADGRDTPLAEGPIAIGLGPIDLPDTLDRPQIVTREGAHRLKVDELHRWAGTIEQDMLRVLGENLGHLLGTSRIYLYPTQVRGQIDYRILATVLRFDGDERGDAILRVRWTILDPATDDALEVRETTYRRTAAGPEPEALVAAMSDNLTAFSRELAAAIRALPRQ